MQDFRNVEAWQLNRQLVLAIYEASSRFPAAERFALSRQIRDSANSIGANIAEAFGRRTRIDAARVLQTSLSEGNETLHHLITALDVGYLSNEEFHSLSNQLEVVRHKVANLIDAMRPRRRHNPRRR